MLTDPAESTPTRSTLRAVIYSDDGRVEFPITHVGVTTDGEVQLMGDDEEGRPFSVLIGGRAADGRDLMDLVAPAGAVVATYREEGGR